MSNNLYNIAKGEKLIYYICRDKPIFKNPLLQIKNDYKFSNLRFNNNFDRQLQQSINNCFIHNNEVQQSIPIVHREIVITSA